MPPTESLSLDTRGGIADGEEKPSVDFENDKSQSQREDDNEEEEIQYPHGLNLVLIFVSLLLAMFLVALDRTIIATAIPYITDEFDSLDDIAWYASSYMLANGSVQLLYGRIYKFYSTKWVFLSAIGLFEIGSLVCGTAPNSKALIIGRAISGLGAAGILSGGMNILLFTVPLHKRPMYSGVFGAVFGISSVAGPLLGGAFTDKLTWRWCFYINLPIGAFAMIIISFILKVPDPKEGRLTIKQKMKRLDFLGTLCFVPSIICLILALQWGGTKYAWGDGRLIALLVVSGTLFILFVGIQVWRGDNATVPPRIIRQRSIAFGFLYGICNSGSMFIFVYYLPIWFQAIKGVDAVHSGIMSLPLILSLAVAAAIGGFATTRIGYYVPNMIASPVVMSIGAGLITTFLPDTGHAKWIGYQVIYGFGLGLGMQSAALAAQAVLKLEDASTGVSIMFFGQLLGGAIFVAVGQNLFTNYLVSNLGQIPGLDLSIINTAGATEIRANVPEQYLDAVLAAYNNALTKCFDIGVAMSCVLIIGALGMEWKNIKKNKRAPTIPERSENDTIKPEKHVAELDK